jgi:hypothetical protein
LLEQCVENITIFEGRTFFLLFFFFPKIGVEKNKIKRTFDRVLLFFEQFASNKKKKKVTMK